MQLVIDFIQKCETELRNIETELRDIDRGVEALLGKKMELERILETNRAITTPAPQTDLLELWAELEEACRHCSVWRPRELVLLVDATRRFGGERLPVQGSATDQLLRKLGQSWSDRRRRAPRAGVCDDGSAINSMSRIVSWRLSLRPRSPRIRSHDHIGVKWVVDNVERLPDLVRYAEEHA